MNEHRHAISNFIIGVVFAVILVAVVAVEYRMRTFVNYPWLQDRELVLEKLAAIETRLYRIENTVIDKIPLEVARSIKEVDDRLQMIEELIKAGR